MRLLVIEDDKTLATQLGKTLSDAGHVVQCANDGSAGLKLAKVQPYDALIVDRMLPKMDGLDVIASLRSSGSRVPILILSALGEVDDRVKGLRSGGDDYLVKPFSYDELMARLDIMVRRSQQQTAPETQLKVGDLVVDVVSRKVSRGHQAIALQSREFRLLEYLARNKGHIVTRTMLLEAVWDYHFDPQTNVIDVHISRLRNKIDKGFDKPLLKTVRGTGYMMDDH